ncbi:uncharacterized protein [Typha angustifolia]|uniref:uncharacterized protein isoform X1 n=1 Tax=Typha angustifolia TaxID=59011 RepID=UPI003C2DF774
MDRSVPKEEEALVGEDFAITPSPPEAKRRRRSVQSKLSWAVPKVGGDVEVVVGAEVERGEEGESEEEGMGKSKRKGKGKPKAGVRRKSPIVNMEATRLAAISNDPLVLFKNSPQKEQYIEELDVVELEVLSGKHCKALASVASKKNNQGKRTTSKASTSVESNLMDSYSNMRQVNGKSNNAANDPNEQSPDKHQNLYDLRLEAKIAAEENLRLSAGKQIHPFFASRTASKRESETQDIMKDVGRCLFGKDYVSCPPIHVFGALEDDIPLDWRGWVFAEGSLLDLNGPHALENPSLSIFKGSMRPLKLEAAYCKKMHLDQLSVAREERSAATVTTSLKLFNGQGQHGKLFMHLDVVDADSDGPLSTRHNSCICAMENKHKDWILNESYWPDCSLWTNKYQPENASQVCGNSESIQFLGEWLKGWHESGRKGKKDHKFDEQIGNEDAEDSLYKDEYDMDEMDDATNIKNVLLITGPVGSGKSAAVYACAKEQGFEVIEVNASDLRNGAHVKQKFGEAMESHGLNRWSCDEIIGSGRRDHLASKSSSGLAVNNNVPKQAINKTLILFEDVDTVFDEDRGFISTVLQLTNTAKWPIVLTSNNKNPILPHLLDRLVLEFKHPSPEELLSHADMICTSEKAKISLPLLKHLIRFCLGDIRKMIMLLQFWCQGRNDYTEREIKCTCGPVPFDIDAAHSVMPRIFPWEFPCELSEKVCKEINQTVSLVEENLQHIKAPSQSQEELLSEEMICNSNMGKGAANIKKTRKKSKLKKRQSVLDCMELPPHANDLDDFSDAPDTPIPHAHQRVKNKRGIVLSSQSDDDLYDKHSPKNNDACKHEPLSLVQPLTDPIYLFRTDHDIQELLERNKEASTSFICDTFNLQDISLVPESSFISGAELIKKDDVLSVDMSDEMSGGCTGLTQSIYRLPHIEVSNLDVVTTDTYKDLDANTGDTCEADVESVYGNEELGDCPNDVEEPPASGYQLMDECSRAGSMWLFPEERGKCPAEVGSVQNTWNKLRSQHLDLKSYVTDNQKVASDVLKLSSRLVHLISEADCMLNSCIPFINDILDPSLMPCDEPDDFSWYDKQFEMGSTYAQHGLCLYTKICANIGSDLGAGSVDLAQEMLVSSSNTMALGKLLIVGNNYSEILYNGNLQIQEPRCFLQRRRDIEYGLYDAILPIIPARLSMSLKGPAFHDYLSFASQISKLECSRLSESKSRNAQRRPRVSRHYLSSGTLSLSPEDVELLARSSCFNEAPQHDKHGEVKYEGDFLRKCNC